MVFSSDHSVIMGEDGKPDAKKTLESISLLIKDGVKRFEKEYEIIKIIGLQHPGKFDENKGRIDVKTLPNFPSLCEINPSELLTSLVGYDWKCYMENDAFTQGRALGFQFFKTHPEIASSSPYFYFGPGTGFGSCFIVDGKPLSHLYDVIIDEEKKLTSEDLLSGWYVEELLKKPVNQASELEVISVMKEYIVPSLIKFIEILTKSDKKISKKFSSEQQLSLTDIFSKTNIFLLSGYFSKEPCVSILPSILREKFPQLTFEFLESETLLSSTYLIPETELNGLRIGYDHISNQITRELKNLHYKKRESNENVVLGIDGYIGIRFSLLLEHLKKTVQEDQGMESIVEYVNFSEYYIPCEEIEKLCLSTMGDEETFGRVFKGSINEIIDHDKTQNLITSLTTTTTTKEKNIYVVYGLGSAYLCRHLKFDVFVYQDLTREELSSRNKKSGGTLPSFGSPIIDNNNNNSEKKKKKKVYGPSYLASKSRHYFDFPILNRLKKELLQQQHVMTNDDCYYIDESNEDFPMMIRFKHLKSRIKTHVLERPFQLKSYYDQGVWGGQWLKKVRNLSHLTHLTVNCAWSYEIMVYMMGIKIPITESVDLEIPFSNILDIYGKEIIGPKFYDFFDTYFPTRVNYDDNFKGDDMAVQIHPDHGYNMENFGESLHQDESYYIIDCDEGAYVHLGVKDDIDINEFYTKCERAASHGEKFDHKKYVNVFPAKKHDLFLIPAGTVHCSGRGSVVLELSATTDRYTFHFYDYLRPDLHGNLRGIHLKHSFNMLRKHPDRGKKFVVENLIQKPVLSEEKGNVETGVWREFMIGYLKYIVFKVIRIEWSDSSCGHDDVEHVEVKQDVETDNESYHILCLVEGSSVTVRTENGECFELLYSYSVIIPYSCGKYSIIKSGDESEDFVYRVLKILPNIPVYDE